MDLCMDSIGHSVTYPAQRSPSLPLQFLHCISSVSAIGWYYTTSTPSQHAGVTTTTTNISILIKLIIIIRIVVHLLVLQLYILLSLQHVKVAK